MNKERAGALAKETPAKVTCREADLPNDKKGYALRQPFLNYGSKDVLKHPGRNLGKTVAME